MFVINNKNYDKKIIVVELNYLNGNQQIKLFINRGFKADAIVYNGCITIS